MKAQSNLNTPIYLNSLQIGERVELYTIIRGKKVCVTKRSKIEVGGFVCPRFLREISILKALMNPPLRLVNHPGRKNIIQLLGVYTEGNYLCFDMERADGTIDDLVKTFDLTIVREQILIDVSNALQYIHEMGFNHNDLSIANIAYIDCEDSIVDSVESSTYNMMKFVLLDFGNTYHKSRPLTIAASTLYTIPLENVKAIKIVKKIDHYVRLYKGKNTTPAEINALMENLRTLVIHKKSDIWSLGVLSFYLYNFKFYDVSTTIDEHEHNLMEKELENTEDIDDNKSALKGHKNFLSKTQIMLIGDNKIRPIVYFSKHVDKKDKKIKRESEIKLEVRLKKKDIYFDLRKRIVECIFNDMTKISGRKFMSESTDLKTFNDIAEHSKYIEEKIINNVVMCLRSLSQIRKRCYMVNLICVIRVVIIWLVTHLYTNDVWSFKNIVTYLSNHYIKPATNVSYIIKCVAFKILEAVDWNLEIPIN
jgi:serine/threonine protein kinase